MRLPHAVWLIVAAFLLDGVATSSAQAQTAPGHGHVNYWLGQGYGHSFGREFSSPYATGRIPTPPYFAIHPPVYYSYPVPRSYGYSPFAYPGIVATPEVIETPAPTAAEVINPYVKPEVTETSEVTSDRTANTATQTMVNPYVGHAELKAGVELAKLLKSGQ